MAIFNKVYKKVANNGNDSDYELVCQIGVDGAPLDIFNPGSSPSSAKPGLIPSLNLDLIDNDVTNTEKCFLSSYGWSLVDSYIMDQDKGIDIGFTGYIIKNNNNYKSNYDFDLVSIPNDGSANLNVVSSSDKKKITGLQTGYGIKNTTGGVRVMHGYSNTTVSATKKSETKVITAFTTSNLMNDGIYGYNFIEKISNSKIKFLVEGLYYVELRFAVSSVEVAGRMDICPYINDTAVRMLAISKCNDVSTSSMTFMHTFFLDINENDTLEFKVTPGDDEVTTKIAISDVMITLLDSVKFVTLNNENLSNRDTMEI